MDDIPPLTTILNIPKMDFEYRGKTYSTRDPVQDEEGAWCAWLARETKLAILRDEDMDEETKARQLDRHFKEVACGKFDWFSENAFNAYRTLKGIAQMLHIQHRETSPEVTTRAAAEMVRAKAASVLESFAKESASDPKAKEVLEAIGITFAPSNTTGSSGSPIPPSAPPATSPPSDKCPTPN